MAIPVGGASQVTFSTTVQNIADAAAQDVRQVLSSTTSPTQGILIDYVNRVSLTILRTSNWKFLLSPPQKFMTQMGVSDYWIGVNGAEPIGTYDTGLGLADVRQIAQGTVFDRTNYISLAEVNSEPLDSIMTFTDSSPRTGRPKQFRNDAVENPYILSIYPAPDNQSTFQPTPPGPVCSWTAGGALANRGYFVKITYVDSFGNESNAGPESKIFVPAGTLLTVNAPKAPASSASGVQYGKFNVYASTTSGSETLQTVSPLTILTDTFTESPSGLTTNGASCPTTNNLEPLEGYLIEFSYYKQRTQLTGVNEVLQVPDDYKDVVVAGVNSLAYSYLRQPQQANEWRQHFMLGLQSMIRDKNLFPKTNYIQPDPASVGSSNELSAIDYFDPGTRLN